MINIKCKSIKPSIFNGEWDVILTTAGGYSRCLIVDGDKVNHDKQTVKGEFLHVDKTRVDSVFVSVEGVDEIDEFHIKKGSIVQ